MDLQCTLGCATHQGRHAQHGRSCGGRCKIMFHVTACNRGILVGVLCAGISKEEDVLVIKSTQHMLSGHSLYAGKVQERMPNLKAARFPQELEALHRVAWYPGGAGAAWLASGGAAGVVRLQWVARR